MKTAISIPNPLFKLAEKMAKRLGLSRSRFFATAVEEYIKAHKSQNITDALNKVFTESDSRLDPTLTKLQMASLSKERW